MGPTELNSLPIVLDQANAKRLLLTALHVQLLQEEIKQSWWFVIFDPTTHKFEIVVSWEDEDHFEERFRLFIS